MIKIIKKISVEFEILFFIFLLFNAIKLTGVQWLITQSTYHISYVFIKNLLFLFLFWRTILLFKSRQIFLICYILQTAYLLIHSTYYLYVGQTFLLQQLYYTFFEGLRALSSIYILFRNPWFYLPLLDIVLVILVFHFYPILRKKIFKISLILIPLALIPTLLAFNRLGYFFSDSIKYGSFNRRNFKYGTIYAQIHDLSINQQDYINKIEYGEPLIIPAKKNLKNIVSIQVESLNADLINFKHNGKDVTPYLNKIARDNIYFPYLLAQHKSGNSSDAEFSVFNAIEAINGFPAAQLTQYDYHNSFVKQLTNHSRLSFHGNVGDFYNRYENLEEMGFDKFWDIRRMELDEAGWGAPDEDVFNFMFNQMKKNDNPFYHHIITMSSHGPFDNVKNYYNNSHYNDIKNNSEKDYLNTFSYVDQALEDFITQVQDSFPETYFFIYSDHTVEIKGDFYSSEARYTLDDYLFEFVPLIIITPERLQYKETSKAVSFLDIAPTILIASGEESTIKAHGENLIPNSDLILKKDIYYYGERFSRQELFNLIKK